MLNTPPLPITHEVFWAEMSPCEHFVHINDDEHAFLSVLERFIGDGLEAGDATVVIATQEHLAALEQRLTDRGLDPVAARWRGTYLPMDAEATLAQFMINGWPDDEMFAAVITEVIQRARRGERKVRAFGEMVALLWAQGHHGATVRLEHLWHDLCEAQTLQLFCAYPRAGFTEDADKSIRDVCALHSRVVAA